MFVLNLNTRALFAQCAEDNATIALILRMRPNKKVTSVDWYSTVKDFEIKHKPLCGVCDIRFKDRLEWLLEHRVSVIKEGLTHWSAYIYACTHTQPLHHLYMMYTC